MVEMVRCSGRYSADSAVLPLRILFIILAVLLLPAAASAEAETDLSGNWTAENILTELDDGYLVSSEAAWAFPFRGFEGVNIIDSGFIIFSIDGAAHRAFYRQQVNDYGNVDLLCTFEDGEELMLKLVESGNRWKYLLRIPSGSPRLSGVTGRQTEEAMQTTDADDPDLTADPELKEEPVEEPEQESYFLFIGLLKKEN